MLKLQEHGCHNVNLVTPTHVVPQVIEAVAIAAEQGLRLPIVYNSSGYDGAETLPLLDGVVDVYMPDFKFWRARPRPATRAPPTTPTSRGGRSWRCTARSVSLPLRRATASRGAACWSATS